MAEHKIMVCGAREIDSRLAKLRSDVVVCSILGLHDTYKKEFQTTIMPGLRARGITINQHLILKMDDIETTNLGGRKDFTAPSIKHVVETFAFLDAHPSSDILMHCHLGLSRSTALCIAYVACKFGVGKEANAVNAVWRMRQTALPNLRLIRAADRALNRRGALIRAVVNHPHITENWRNAHEKLPPGMVLPDGARIISQLNILLKTYGNQK